MLYLKDEIEDEDVEYDKHSKLAKSMSEKEIRDKMDEVLKEMHILDAIHAAYNQQTEIYKRPGKAAEPYWQD